MRATASRRKQRWTAAKLTEPKPGLLEGDRLDLVKTAGERLCLRDDHGAGLAARVPRAPAGIGLRPLVLELITAALLAGLAVRARSVGELAALCLLAAAGVALGFIDAAVHRLPDLLTLPLYAGVTVLLVAAAAAGHHWAALLRAALAGAVLACFFFALIIVIPAGIGAGDAKLGLAVGSVLGWYGWPVLLSGTFYAFLAAAAYALGLLVLRRVSRQDSFAFGPFLIAGALVAILI